MKTLRLTYQLIAIPAAFSLSACHTQSSQQQPTPPNIIYILADDMGYGDINAFNPHSQIPTPTLDSMASAGIMFTDAHSNSSVSTPTRYGTLTGRYAFRSSLKKGVLTGYSSPLIEKGRETIASFLSNQGYQTACIGKWHLGLDWVKKDAKKPLFTGNEWNVENTDNVDYTAYISGGPTDCGFGYSCILPASLDMPPYIYIEDGKVTAPVNGYTEDYLEKKVRGARYRHGDVADDFNHQECLSYFTQKSEEYIARASRQDTPYFLYLALTAPHAPWLPGEEFKGRSTAGAYGDFVCMIDETVRRIYTAVERGGKAANTLVIFTSDNGSMWLEEDIAQTGHRANGAWNGAKSDLWEGGHRIPLLATWPNVIIPGSHSGHLICSTDLFATLADMLGTTLPPHTAEDSFSFWHELSGKKTKKESSGYLPCAFLGTGIGNNFICLYKWKVRKRTGNPEIRINGASAGQEVVMRNTFTNAIVRGTLVLWDERCPDGLGFIQLNGATENVCGALYEATIEAIDDII